MANLTLSPGNPDLPACELPANVSRVWSATMTVGRSTTVVVPVFGWSINASFGLDGALTDADFVYANETYEFAYISTVATDSGTLTINFDATNSGSISDAAVRSVMTLYIDGTAFALEDGTYRETFSIPSLYWENIGFTWADGDTVELEMRVTE